jgi:hypothetical protein
MEAQAPATLPSESVITQIKKSVVFIVAKQSAATGFLLLVPEPRLGKDLGYVWLVTCKHVLRSQNADGTQGPYVKEVLVRINTQSPDSTGRQYDWARLEVADEKGNLLWFTDSGDDSVDLALTRVGLNQSVVDAKFIGLDLLMTKAQVREQGIDENDDILFAGLFAWDPGARKNYPIVRHGRIALIPEERVPLVRGQQQPSADVYLVDITSFGGNSGSPVFVRVGGVRETLKGPTLTGFSYHLLGVMQGFFPEAAPVAVEADVKRGAAAQNSGIAMVIPADKILAILNSTSVKSHIDALVEAELKKRATTPN